jgi:hypothetical protein
VSHGSEFEGSQCVANNLEIEMANRRRIPRDGKYQQRLRKSAWKRLIKERRFNLAVTLAFNREGNPEIAKRTFGTFLALFDGHYLGRSWSKQPASERTMAVASIEHPETNIHLHVLMRVPRVARSRSLHRIEKRIGKCWRKVAPSGTCDCQYVYDLEGIASYQLKDFTRPGHEDLVILSSDFHPSNKSKRRKRPRSR